MTEEQYNGWTNYDTWLMALNIDNDEGLHNSVLEFVESSNNNNMDDLKEYIADMFELECHGVVFYKIFDHWSVREFNDIDWYELLNTYKDYAKEINGDE